ncbi:protein phosphatase CheZ [Echinimonas agarilytica]|uniref:Protein phosphatase CheZ n=1 Tax=Echinimonas agarilytica TaxID=1215918 RepID=A0AA42B6Y2_9GAMM|nr:protein phosphatase CheZ [Echinimonas agarilytica]MCM2678986.1 protein phosphatase CheZ [Echinimonas agarilytica]
MTTIAPRITLEQAKQLVELIETGEQEKANNLLDSVVEENINRAGGLLQLDNDLFEQIGKLTRQLHTALSDFQLDPRITDLARTEMPDAQSRLNYVIEMTENAANKTMDAVEFALPVADKLSESFENLQPRWSLLMKQATSLDEFKGLCQDTNTFLTEAHNDTNQLHGKLTDVLMAQDFQDLTGQVIRRVIQLVQEVEDSLIHMLKVFGENMENTAVAEESSTVAENKAAKAVEAEGPVMDAENREDVVNDQDDVDDLLSSLGF